MRMFLQACYRAKFSDYGYCPQHRARESKGLESKEKELFFLFTDLCLVVMESDKEGNKISSKPSSAVFPHKKTKKSSIPAADPAGMQNYGIFKGDKGQI